MWSIILWFLLIPLLIVLILCNLWVLAIIVGILFAIVGLAFFLGPFFTIKDKKEKGEKVEFWKDVFPLITGIFLLLGGVVLIVFGIITAH